jgi:hypothetical protein
MQKNDGEEAAMQKSTTPFLPALLKETNLQAFLSMWQQQEQLREKRDDEHIYQDFSSTTSSSTSE